MTLCAWCKAVAVDSARGRFCGRKCRQAAHRQRRRASFGDRAAHGDGARVSLGAAQVLGDSGPRRFAYADPPYPGFAELYADQATYGGEVDHAELCGKLEQRRQAGELAGYAVSTSSKTLLHVLPHVPPFPASRVCAWVKPIGVSGDTRGPHSTWEPLVVVGGRKMKPGIRDWAEALRAKTASGGGSDLIGRKPQAFCAFLFDMLGMLPGDDFEDLYPGSGIVTRAWRELSTLQERQLSLELSSSVAGDERRRPPLLSLLQERSSDSDSEGPGMDDGAPAGPSFVDVVG